MTCSRGGTNLSDEQIGILKRFIDNHEKRGTPICSCDVERVIYMHADDSILARLNSGVADLIVARRRGLNAIGAR